MNHLANETSPYLLQHADNPVDWYPWGADALARAQAENKPILLSIGYSACHWCHVMAHESFEDDDTAAYMNAHFISVKVDREERPDIDDIYMQATLAFTGGHGGWPMTVFLAPDARPFHAGTYFPKDDRYGMPSFKRVMAAVVDAFHNRADQMQELAAQVTEGLQRDVLGEGAAGGELNEALLTSAYQTLVRGFDPINGGLNKTAPKFPSPMNLEFVLRTLAHSEGDRADHAREVLTFTLRKMANGGIYDQLGGGFHRYSVDAQWLVPHFEKMLYDNAQLSRLYTRTWQATSDPFFRRVAEETFGYILADMTAPSGGFYSTRDADSEGEEGKFYVWSLDEIRGALPPELADAVIAYYGVTAGGNFEGQNILNVPKPDVANELGIDEATLHERLDRARETLLQLRETRIHPGRDEKILTSWNGLMLASFAEAARAFSNNDYRQTAINNAEFILREMVRDSRLLRTHKDGASKLNGYLEDYANVIDGLLELYQTTFEARYFAEARRLADHVLAHFAAPDGGFFDTSDDHETLIARPRGLQDNATPSGNSMMAKVLALLAAYTGDDKYDAAARGALAKVTAAMREYPGAFGEALNAADLLVRGVQEVAIVGDPQRAETRALLATVNGAYRPNLIRAFTPHDVEDNQTPPLLDYRALVDGKPAAYVCEHFICKRPVTDWDALAALLR